MPSRAQVARRADFSDQESVAGTKLTDSAQIRRKRLKYSLVLRAVSAVRIEISH